MTKILAVYGTRPEAIKMAPLISAIGGSKHLQVTVAVTGQHRQMLDQVNSLFAIVPKHDLNIIVERQKLQGITCRALDGVSDLIEAEKPDAVLVQGDTTTCFAAALAAFYQKVPVVHLEAGLRTGDVYNPFPEEMNRAMVSRIARLHLAPTRTSKRNLLAEGIPASDISITGNTVIDALLEVAARRTPPTNQDIRRLAGRRTILVTAHRRESWGEPMRRAAEAMAEIARRFPSVVLLLPVHLNPVVREVLLPPLRDLENVVITEPLGYTDFVGAMQASDIVLTDSGGVQEEAPSLGKPVLVMRETTERPEAVVAGTVKLVGTDKDKIVDAVSTLLTDNSAYDAMAKSVNPYGDGHASARCVQAIEHFFGHAGRPLDFVARLASDQAQAPRVS
ncbi:MAG: UDP-N-acetylglucosamine 2-epimerase (non-hydrolyzing) [Alphaproteobacteria bacterium]|nr:UDP-N-acetylglucosamine 2-epimerase (non-hydrolyzing) [Alphaproteobacteria bacterium]MBU1561615.1 UDP-N-acetylglucosamine 2-epimerase (non-hydrolyzing) [Alphaproteobacteria bacterium]MBU2302404.1 UDP-N-acetylglucosamine 2-epimerase (non-hydrolyzing) [Alphaproteobacteria bacterium]MBU2368684.1 UDP-N-acetylglucosamine 2-epimerase (non-hydrolyzing) [Alphaproteobacteria bacterium]